MHSGALYRANDPDLMAEQLRCLEKMYDFNATRPSEMPCRSALLQEMLAECGEGCYVEPPFYANWGGRHVHFGKGVYANFGLTLVDDTDIYIGDYTMLAPHVTVAAGTHPICPELRERGYQYNLPVHIGKNCWVGAGAVILPGVTIGDGSVIGAGSVVTGDIPAGKVAVGNPCRVLRDIDEHDRAFYRKNIPIDPSLWEAP